MTEISLWGLALAVTTFISLFSIDREDGFLSVLSSLTLAVFWGINVSMWWTSAISWMILTDTLFALLTAFLFYLFRYRWMLGLTLGYLFCVICDIIFSLKGMSYLTFATSVNAAFAFQMFCACFPGLRGLDEMLRRLWDRRTLAK